MGKGRVLLVDDDSLSRILVSAKLQGLGGIVTQACDGLEAYALLKKQPFDLVIADLEMPKLDGYDLLGCIRGTPPLKHLPVVVLTAREDRASHERALIAGATSYLVKPLNWLAFGEHIKHLLMIGLSSHSIAAASESDGGVPAGVG